MGGIHLLQHKRKQTILSQDKQGVEEKGNLMQGTPIPYKELPLPGGQNSYSRLY